MTDQPEPHERQSTRRRKSLALSGLAVLFLVGLLIALRPSNDDDSAAPSTASAGVATAPTQETETEGLTSTDTEPPATTTAATTTPTPRRIRITVSGGRPVGGIARVSVEKNEDVVLVVRADAPESVHLHGYDREAPVAPNAPAQIGFKASEPGRFELELEESGVLIAEISVEP